MSKVLIIFQSDTEPLEQLALAVAVGAVEAEGAIRLRRLAAPGAPEVGHQSYGTIKRSDLEWAEAIVVGLEHATPVPQELDPLLDLLREGGLADRHGWIFTEAGAGVEPTPAQSLIEDALRRSGVDTELPGTAAASGPNLAELMKALGRLSSAAKS